MSPRIRSALRRLRSGAALAATVLLLGACATAGATLGSGVGDRLVREPPYAAGRAVRPGEAGSLVHLPVVYQRGSAQDPIFEPSSESGSEVAALLAEMNAFLDSLGVSAPLGAQAPPRTVAPDVRFGCETDGHGECASESRDLSVQGKPWMRLAVGRPSLGWSDWLRGALGEAGADAALVLTLEVGQYWTHQRNLRGDKEARLGTGYSVDLPWLTSLDQPIQVLQLTGALVDAEGRAVRIAAEGLLARRTNLILGALGAQELVTEEDVRRLRSLRRDDLPGRPLVWRVALRSLVAELTGGAGAARATP